MTLNKTNCDWLLSWAVLDKWKLIWSADLPSFRCEHHFPTTCIQN